ncbi:MAG TPA: NTP transferase domain-containing protein, partial [Candidatus Omnitrophota bacterium]|nr:NTP transferase domain-containing protein [Candidatus Omnitrophota bacterium]
MKDTVAVILAAGRGTRMKSKTPKVLHEVLGKPIIGYVFEALDDAGVSETITVAGYGSDLLKQKFPGADVVIQKELLGSGDAVRTAKKVLSKYSGDVVVVCGDTPLVRGESIRALVAKHKNTSSSATILTARVKDPTNYGRIVRDDNGAVTKIVEELEAPLYEKVIDEVNVGTYCFKAGELFRALDKVRSDNAKKEFYLTDVINVLHKEGK